MRGQCLCRAITIEAEEHHSIEACHCGMCRTWSGGPMLAVHAGPDVRIDGAGMLKVYRSSEWAERAFCSQCGTHIYYKMRASPEYILTAGLFTDVDFELQRQIFIDRKPAYYAFANATADRTEAEVFAQFAAGSDEA